MGKLSPRMKMYLAQSYREGAARLRLDLGSPDL